MNYYEKYLKYKYKYIKLKQKGGDDHPAPPGEAPPGEAPPVEAPPVEAPPGEAQAGEAPPVEAQVGEAQAGEAPPVEAPQVYIPFFHSCHLDQVKIVPEGSIVVNTSTCGIPTLFNDALSRKMMELFKNKNDILRNPIENKEALTKELGKEIIIHPPGSEYLDMNFSYHLIPELDRTDGYFKQECSGLMNLDNGICEITSFEQRRGDYPKSIISPLYKNSIFPTENEVSNIQLRKLNGTKINIHFRETLKENERFGELTLSKLLQMYPGIYYIYTCRPPCSKDEQNKEAVRIQRRKSLDMVSEEERKRQIKDKINDIIDNNLFLESKKKKGKMEIMEIIIKEETYIILIEYLNLLQPSDREFLIKLKQKLKDKSKEKKYRHLTKNFEELYLIAKKIVIP